MTFILCIINVGQCIPAIPRKLLSWPQEKGGIVRNIFLIFAITAASLFGQSSIAANPIDGWDETIPVSAELTSTEIETKVADLTFEDEGNYVGGQAWNFKLVDYFTYEDHDGSLTYNIRVQYRASMSLDYGRTETTRICESLIVIDPQLKMNVGAVECPDIQ